jgi:5-carboxymethyl-2-hydroxymuconate isomerase
VPHCIIEYSQELDAEVEPSTLLSSVFYGALETGLFSENDIKVRALAFNHFTTGNLRQNFVHVTVKILSGRNLEQRKNLTQLILVKLNELFSNSISLTVEITEIEKESYAKNIK